jgi:hypothetical protein
VIGVQEVMMLLLTGPVMLVFGAVLVFPFWRIFSKAGFPGWYGLIMVVPLLNVLGLFYLALATWPAHHRDSGPA